MRYRDLMLTEIEIGGEVDSSSMDNLRAQDFKSKQLPLFPELPTLEPELPKKFKHMGRIGGYFVARTIDNEGSRHGKEYSYVLLDQGTPIGYVAVVPPKANFGGGYNAPNPPLDGNGLRVVSVVIERSHAGQNLALKLYQWLLQNVCDYILPDDLQTQGGVAIWRNLLRNTKTFEVMVYDADRGVIRRRKPGRDFQQVYKTDNLRPFVTLKGKAEELIG